MNIESKIASAMEKVSLKDDRTILAAANAILEANGLFNAGDTVVVIDDPTYPFAGQKGKFRGASANAGFVNVEFPNGATVPLMANQLLTVR